MASSANKSRGTGRVPWRLLGWGTAVALLILPLVAMQFTSEVNWTVSDFIFAGVMFGLVGGTLELAVSKSGNLYYRGGVVAAVATAFLLVWINGAVGIIGGENNPANLMFLGVIAIAIGGAGVARFRARGMALAMAWAALAEALVAVPVVVLGLGASEPPGLPGILVLIGGFAAMWAGSALLFRKAAQ